MRRPRVRRLCSNTPPDHIPCGCYWTLSSFSTHSRPDGELSASCWEMTSFQGVRLAGFSRRIIYNGIFFVFKSITTLFELFSAHESSCWHHWQNCHIMNLNSVKRLRWTNTRSAGIHATRWKSSFGVSDKPGKIEKNVSLGKRQTQNWAT